MGSVFYNGKNFCLWGASYIKLYDHQTLSIQYYVIIVTIHYSNVQNKVVQQYENECNLQRCHVNILVKHLDMLSGAKANDVFYLTPLPKKPAELGKS